MTTPAPFQTPSKAALIGWGAFGTVAVVLLVIALASPDPTQKPATVVAPTTTADSYTYVPPPPDLGHTVTYTIIGQAASQVSYSTSGFGIEQAVGVPLPWSKTLEFSSDGRVYASVNAQNSVGGKIECTIDIDGVTVSDHTSTGEFAIVQCTASQ